MAVTPTDGKQPDDPATGEAEEIRLDDDLGGDETLAAAAAASRTDYRPPRAAQAEHPELRVVQVVWMLALLGVGGLSAASGDFCLAIPLLAAAAVNAATLLSRMRSSAAIAVNVLLALAIAAVPLARVLPKGGWLPKSPPPTLAIEDVSLFERDDGITEFAFAVRRDGDTANGCGVRFATADGTASSADDYKSTAGDLYFQSKEVTKWVVVEVAADWNIEPDETFVVNLSRPGGVAITDAQGLGTIENDDDPPPP